MQVETAGLSLPAPYAHLDLRPVGGIALFLVLYLVLALLAAAPFALLRGQTVLGLWFILPFTLVFVLGYQRLVDGKGLGALGLDPRAPLARHVLAGFFGAGLALLMVQAVHLETGATHIRAINVAAMDLQTIAAGVVLALGLNFGTGLGEELVFRGYVLRRLLVGYRSQAPGVLISSVLYSAVHVQRTRDALVLLNLFLLGIVLALAVVLTRSLWASIGIHTGWNFWGDGLDLRLRGAKPSHVLSYGYHLQGWSDVLAYRMVSAAALVALAGYLVLLLRRQSRAAHSSEEDP